MSLTARDVATPAGVYGLDDSETDFGGRVRDMTISATVWGDFKPDAPSAQTPSDGQPFVSQTADFLCRSAEGLSVGGWLQVRGRDWRILSHDEIADGQVRLRLESL
jgi:hypothetical protein